VSINSVNISGHLGADPEVRTTQSGTQMMSFRMAVNKRKRDQNGEWYDYANWVGVVVFGNRVDWLSKELRKGKLVYVSGELSFRSYEKDGERHSYLEVIADEVDFDRPPRDQQGQRQGQRSQPSQQGAYRQQGGQQAYFDQRPMDAQPDAFDEDIPF